MRTPPPSARPLARRFCLSGLFLLASLLPTLLLAALPPGLDEEQTVLAVLQSSASPAEKDAACARLKFIGTPRSVPALAALLTDENLSHSARYALESMHFEDAGRALVGALPNTHGLLRVGLLNSLGVRRELWAAPLVTKYLADSDPAVAAATARALGRIGGPVALKALQSAARRGTGPVQTAAINGLLEQANRLLTEANPAAARPLFNRVYGLKISDQARAGAYRGLILSSGSGGLKLMTRAITGPSGPAQLAALQLVRELPDPRLTDTVARLLPRLSPPLQLALIESLAQRGDSTAVPALLQLAATTDDQVRLAVIDALDTLGDASTVPLLAGFAATGLPPEQKAARQALADLRRGNVSAMIVAQLETASPGVQAELVRALGARGDADQLPRLQHLADVGPDAVRASALRAIGMLVDNDQLGSLVGYVLYAKDPQGRAEAAEALNSACQHIRSRRGRVDGRPLLEAMNAGNPDARIALLPVFSGLDSSESQRGLRLGLEDTNPKVHAAAARALGDSIDVEMLDDLVMLAQTTHEENLRQIAISGAVRLCTDEKAKLTNGRRVGVLRLLLASTKRPEQRRLVLAGLGEVADPDALRVVEPVLADTDVQSEAAVAAIKIAAALPSSESQNSEAVLQKGLASATTDSTRDALQKAIEQIEANADYISDWQVAGPYRHAGQNYAQLFDAIFPPEMQDPKDIPWKRLPPGTDPARPWAMDLEKALGGVQCVAYARTWVHAERDQPVLLELGSDDGVKVWINDDQVYGVNKSRSLQPGSDKVPVKLHSGWNQLLLKVTQKDQGWGFCARFRSRDGSHLEGLECESAPKPGESKTPPAPGTPGATNAPASTPIASGTNAPATPSALSGTNATNVLTAQSVAMVTNAPAPAIPGPNLSAPATAAPAPVAAVQTNVSPVVPQNPRAKP